MKLNFKKSLNDLEGIALPIVDESGKKVGEQLLSRNLANLLVNAQTENAIKFYDWALKLYKDGWIEVDGSDKQTLYDFIKNDKRIVNLIKAQLLKLMDATRSTSENNIDEKSKQPILNA